MTSVANGRLTWNWITTTPVNGPVEINLVKERTTGFGHVPIGFLVAALFPATATPSPFGLRAFLDHDHWLMVVFLWR